MANCKNCLRSGLFLSVDHNGLCGSCSPLVIMDITQKGRLISDCMKLVDESKNLDVQITRYDFLMENLRALLVYEKKGIPTISPLPSFLHQQYAGKRDKLVLDHLASAFEAATYRVPLTISAKSKINQLNKILLKARDYKDRLVTRTSLDALERRIIEMIHKIQLEGYLNDASKAEFKGQRKKALDQYYEALYFLKHDEIDDALQAAHISKIEAKIAELGAAMKTADTKG